MSPEIQKRIRIFALLVPSPKSQWDFFNGFLVRCLKKGSVVNTSLRDFHILVYDIKKHQQIGAQVVEWLERMP